MRDLSKLSMGELAALISEALKKEGVDATLSGGACAEIYSSSKYVTGDLDFVVNYVWSGNVKKIEKAMTSLGFEKNGRIYINYNVAYSVEFPPGPVAIGEEYNIKPSLLKLKTGTLSLLSPTDSVKDRLTGFFHGNDAQCLEQAVMIYQMNKVQFRDIENWASKEGRPEKFEEFKKRVRKGSK